MKTRRENYRYEECGLKVVTLIGIEVTRCSQCSNFEVSIPHIEDLHRLITCLTPEKEVRLAARAGRWEFLTA